MADSSPALAFPPATLEIDYVRLFDLSQDLMCVAGLDGYFKRVNPSWSRVLGWSEEELLSRPVADFMHPDDRERTLHARAALAQGVLVRDLENRYLCKDGSHRWLSWQSSVDLVSRRVYAVARDITDRRREAQEQLVFSKLECTGILAGGIAHDYNNLLAGLMLNLDMVEAMGEMNVSQQKYLHSVRESIRSAATLTQQLITFADGGVSERRVTDLASLLQQATEIALLGSGIRADLAIERELRRVSVDEAQISQVISGIVMNGREAMGLTGTIRVEAANVLAGPDARCGAGEFVRFRIIDQGAGIPPDVLPKVFDPYFSTKERGSRKGMGLGLTICRSVLQKHGGAIEIHSAPGSGTTVTCHLPVVP